MSPAWTLCRDARARAGLSQRELATRAGVSPSTVARIERGRMEPTLDLLIRIVRACALELRMRLEPDDGSAVPVSHLDLGERLDELRAVSEVAIEARRGLRP